MTPQERQAKLDEIKPFALIIGFKNGMLDACVCLDEKDFNNEKRKFDYYKVFDLTSSKVLK